MVQTKNQNLLALLELSPILVPYFLGFFVFRGFYSILPLYLQIKNGYTDTQIVEVWAIVSSIALFFGALSRIPAGIISDRIGRIKAIFSGYVLYFIALVIFLYFDDIFFSVLAFTIIRIALNLYAMTGRGIVSQALREKGLKNGLLSSMVGTGSLVGPIVLSYVLENHSPDAMIITVILVMAIDIVLFLIMLRLVPLFFGRISDESFELDLTPISRHNQFVFDGFKIPGVMQSIVLFMVAGFVYGLITSVYTIYAYNILGLSVSSVGLIVGLGSVTQILWAPLTGYLYMRFQDAKVRVFAWIGLFVASFLTLFGPVHYLFFFTGYLVLNMGNASFFTMEITRLGRIVKKEHFSLIFGTATTLVIMGNAVTNSISSILYNIQPNATFIVSTVLAGITMLFLLLSGKEEISSDELLSE